MNNSSSFKPTLLITLLSAICVGGAQSAFAQSRTETPAEPEAFSLFGKPLTPPPIPAEAKKEMESRLSEARTALEKNPDDPEAIIWVGRRTAYLGRYREAVAVFTKGIDKHPRYAKLYRHRGHRYITLRKFDQAVADLEKASKLIEGTPDEIEPDGMPNARNIPTSTSHSNIWYHLGLAYYLKGDFENALRCYRRCLDFSKNPDMLSATSHWLYMTLMRLNRKKEADAVLERIEEKADIIENQDYHRLLLMYKGKTSPESLLEEAEKSGSSLSFPTIGYGVGNYHFYNGRREEAVKIFQKILKGAQWASFGYIAAEAISRGQGSGIGDQR